MYSDLNILETYEKIRDVLQGVVTSYQNYNSAYDDLSNIITEEELDTIVQFFESIDEVYCNEKEYHKFKENLKNFLDGNLQIFAFDAKFSIFNTIDINLEKDNIKLKDKIYKLEEVYTPDNASFYNADTEKYIYIKISEHFITFECDSQIYVWSKKFLLK